MIINEISIANFRNHAQSRIGPDAGLNLICGPNGAGKTTILEAIAISGLTKSFLPAQDAALTRKGADGYRVEARAVNALGTPYFVKTNYLLGAKKKISNSFADSNTAKDIIGQLPLVILSPDYKSITFGSPENRRSFLDGALCQTESYFLSEALKYSKALKQRNHLLNSLKLSGSKDLSLVEPWTEMLIKSGAEIIFRRNRFVNELVGDFNRFYSELSEGAEAPELRYMPSHLPETEDASQYSRDQIRETLEIKSALVKHDEPRRGVTLFGPQKDDLRIIINGGTAKDYASQGQHKSLLIALKFAEFFYMKAKREETPVVLLDDIFSELDSSRSKRTLGILMEQRAQTFITSTDTSIVNVSAGLLGRSKSSKP